MKPLIIFGTGQIAELAAFYFRQAGRDIAAFAVDQAFISTPEFQGKPLLAFESLHETHPPDRYELFIAVSYQQMNRLRKDKYLQAKSRGYTLASYISPHAIWHKETTRIGENCFIQEFNNIQPYVQIGDNVFLWAGNHIGHHSRIAGHCFIASHVVVSGNVTIAERCFIGVNATLRDGIAIGEAAVLGAGVTVLRDVAEGEVWLAPEGRMHPKKSGELKKL